MSFKIHELPADTGRGAKRKRIGRGEGSGRGKTAGKGHKGQQARAGGGKRGVGFEGGQTPLIRRVPKYGFRNTAFRIPRAEVTLEQLNRFDAGATVDLAAIHAADLVRNDVVRVKVIATGKIAKKLTIKLQGFSAGARAAIEAAGGVCEVVQ